MILFLLASISPHGHSGTTIAMSNVQQRKSVHQKKKKEGIYIIIVCQLRWCCCPLQMRSVLESYGLATTHALNSSNKSTKVGEKPHLLLMTVHQINVFLPCWVRNICLVGQKSFRRTSLKLPLAINNTSGLPFVDLW